MTHVLPAWTHELRRWQRECMRGYLKDSPQDFLLVATPGSGKTCMGVRLMHHHLATMSVDRVIVITPRDHITNQWIRAAHTYGGIELDRIENSHILDYGIHNIGQNFHGYAITYQQATSEYGILAFQAFMQHFRQRVLVIFDELHHAGRDSDWGKCLQNVFGHAVHRAALSGTPFRTDATPLPFVRYTSTGECQADFAYTYKDALHEGVCRSVIFPKFEGDFEWWNGEKVLRHTFRDNVTEQEARQRLKAAITSEWLDAVLDDAHQRLLTCRRHGHSDAAGLVVCMDIYHARRVAERVQAITGDIPEVITSDDPQSSERLRMFASSTRPWLVAVHMVSEGVDIPRLRVGVYATNVLTEIYFRQFVGRFVRTIDYLECDQSAAIFIPSDDVLMSHAKQVHDERIHQAKVDLQDLLDEIARTSCGSHGGEQTSWIDQDDLRFKSVYAQGRAIPDGVIVLFGEEFTAREYAAAKANVPPAAHSDQVLYGYMLCARLQASAVNTQDTDTNESSHATDSAAQQETTMPLREQLTQARQLEQRLIGNLRSMYAMRTQTDVPEDFWQTLYAKLNKLVGVKSNRFCSLEQHEHRIQYLKQLIAQEESSYAGH